jgi:hypothetical protein
MICKLCRRYQPGCAGAINPEAVFRKGESVCEMVLAAWTGADRPRPIYQIQPRSETGV